MQLIHDSCKNAQADDITEEEYCTVAEAARLLKVSRSP